VVKVQGETCAVPSTIQDKKNYKPPHERRVGGKVEDQKKNFKWNQTAARGGVATRGAWGARWEKTGGGVVQIASTSYKKEEGGVVEWDNSSNIHLKKNNSKPEECLVGKG